MLEIYRNGQHHRGLEDGVANNAWRRGRTPGGRAKFAGMTNGNPPVLLFDIEVHSDAGR